MWERTHTYVRTYSPWTGVYDDSTRDGKSIDDNLVCRIHTHVRHDLWEFGVWSSPRSILFVNRNNDNHRNYLRLTKEKRKKKKYGSHKISLCFSLNSFLFPFFSSFFIFFIFTQYETKRNSHDHAISRRRIISFFRVDNTKTEIHTISITNRKVSLCFVE